MATLEHRVDRLEGIIERIDARLDRLEAKVDNLPTREDYAQLPTIEQIRDEILKLHSRQGPGSTGPVL